MIVGAFLLLVLAAALVAAELFLPSHGILGLIAVVCALASVIIAFRVAPALGLFFGLAVVILTPLVFYWAVRLYPKSPIGKRIMLDTPRASPADRFTEESARLAQLVGQRGVALTMLRPAGSVELDDRRIDCVSESDIIYPGTPVEVIRVSGLKVIVKPVA